MAVFAGKITPCALPAPVTLPLNKRVVKRAAASAQRAGNFACALQVMAHIKTHTLPTFEIPLADEAEYPFQVSGAFNGNIDI
jgi:hypothetical protein